MEERVLNMQRRELVSYEGHVTTKGSVVDVLRLWKKGSCTYYPAQRLDDSCLTPRSCFDCLNTYIEGEEEGCMIDEAGKCVSKKYYNPELDYQRVEICNSTSVPDGGPVQFTAPNVTYCDLTDPVCAYCRESVFTDPYCIQTVSEKSRFCIGSGGCVCTSVCESKVYEDNVGGAKCIGDALTYKDSKSNMAALQEEAEHKGKGPWVVLSVVLGCLVLVLAIAVVVYRRRSRSSSPTDAASASEPEGVSPPPSGPDRSLNLFGWQAMRQNLIDKEQAELNDPGTMTHVTPYVQFADMVASAPDAEIVPMAFAASAPDHSSHLSLAASAPEANFSLDALLPSAPSFDDESISDTDELDML
ncbi:hypothetical protein Poli38472_009382 [Pythium oligandrum]|uniref:Uncharacterized protein n=1 Tax=Pythium oligandrum TaxID=41045 RepID=A0A8K1CL15_PYTOL|nr:hypothetical protein Poli38472_009382 [Pythium oligandrum]|eukprot:TMW65215.1 hypothetical protein Poli38472_009382 [Pythium oligandrum]